MDVFVSVPMSLLRKKVGFSLQLEELLQEREETRLCFLLPPLAARPAKL